MLIRLPFLFLGALGLPVMALLAIAMMLAQLRIGVDLDPTFPVLAVVGLVMMLWLRDARKLALSEPRPTLLTRVARLAPWLMVPGAVAGLGLGAYAYHHVVSRDQAQRASLGRGFCRELELNDRRCPSAVDRCVPRDAFQPEPEAFRACIEARLR